MINVYFLILYKENLSSDEDFIVKCNYILLGRYMVIIVFKIFIC